MNYLSKCTTRVRYTKDLGEVDGKVKHRHPGKIHQADFSLPGFQYSIEK